MGYDKDTPSGWGYAINQALGDLTNLFRVSSPFTVNRRDPSTGQSSSEEINPFGDYFGGFKLGGKNISIVPEWQRDTYDAIAGLIAKKKLEESFGGNDLETFMKFMQLENLKLRNAKLRRGGSVTDGDGDGDFRMPESEF